MTSALALAFPDIDPVALSLGPIAIRWYSLAYIVGLLLGWQYCRWLTRLPPKAVSSAAIDDFFVWATLGVILGGRLGFVLFYNLDYFLANPLQVFFVWRGGMSFHGGLLGVVLATFVFARRAGIHPVALADIVVAAVPIGLFFGRLANFVNAELHGRPTDLPWGIVFPGPEAGAEPRHPSQLYEAGLEGLVLFLLLLWLVRRGGLERLGLSSGVFLLGYGMARFVVEFFREPDVQIGFLVGGSTMGQLLSLPMILVGLGLALWSRRSAA